MRSHTRRFAGMSNWHLLNYGVGTSCIANCGKGSSGKQPRPKFQSWLELRDCWEECDRLRSVKLKFETTFGLVWPICSARNFPSCFENGEANAFAVLHPRLYTPRENNETINQSWFCLLLVFALGIDPLFYSHQEWMIRVGWYLRVRNFVLERFRGFSFSALKS